MARKSASDATALRPRSRWCQSRNRPSAARTSSRSRSADHGVRKVSCRQTPSTSPMRVSIPSASAPYPSPSRLARVTPSAIAWTTLPKPWEALVARAPPASRSRNHLAGHSVIEDNMLAVTGTGRSAATSGRSLAVRARVPHQFAGSAAGTRARSPTRSTASRASLRAAASRRGSGWPGSETVRRSSATRPASDSGRRGRPDSWRTRDSPVGKSSWRKRDGCSPSSSGDATAVTSSRRRARVQAT